MEIRKISYKDYINKVPTFFSLDISVNSTGWVKSVDGEITYGTYSIEAKDELGRRKEFRSFLISQISDRHYPVVFVEDVIAGTNFKTTKGLIQLNTIVDDLKEYGLLDIGEIKRIDNKKWKMYLRKASNYDGDIKKEEDKELIRNCLKELSFSPDVKQDIYDAMGIAIAVIYRDTVLVDTPKTENVLKKDLKKGYTIAQFDTKDTKFNKKLESFKKKYGREVEEFDWSNENRDILYLFKSKITKDGIDDKIYVIHVNNMKLSTLALTKGLLTDKPTSVLIITKTRS